MTTQGFSVYENSVTPPTPAAGYRVLYPVSDGWKQLDSAGSARYFAKLDADNASLTVAGGLNVGTAAGAVVGGIKATGVGTGTISYLYNVVTYAGSLAVTPIVLSIEQDFINNAAATYTTEVASIYSVLRYRGSAKINAVNSRDVVGVQSYVFNYNTSGASGIPVMVAYQSDMRNLGTGGVYSDVATMVQFYAKAITVNGGTVAAKYSFYGPSGAGSAAFYDGLNVGTITSQASTAQLFVAGDTLARLDYLGFRNGASNSLVLWQAGGSSVGTLASPGATANGDILLDIRTRGYQTTTGAFTGALASIRFITSQSFTSTAQGTEIVFYTVPNGSTTVTQAMKLDQAQGMTVAGAFGCNTKAAQGAFASGGALAAYAAGANGLSTGAAMSALHALVVNIRAALVANGIMS